ncbi:protein artemis-like [Agrilus planipennis]|uniref:Protein artemis n=1 Tax=Agrilus planipennis TaxID=224129 RepID=A0A1W4WSD0_AGRPL|nr:protein artemis-like [Agrilus planipennis]
MSNFPGLLPEVPNLSIDRFDGNNYYSTIYLLSHCHFDHLGGIDDPWFLEHLFERSDVFIYMSDVSAQILKGLKPHLSSKIKHLPINSPTLLKVPSHDKNCDTFISVTLIPAGHCPGSVMFLIETNKIILYTGDFRIKPQDIKRFTAFYMLGDTNGDVKNIDKVYLDTTFFHPDHLSFPSREDVVNNLFIFISEWLEKDENNLIFLHTCAHIGYEDLFIELYKKLNISIHVTQSSIEFYKHIPEIGKAVTLNEHSKIHACKDINPKLSKKMCKTYYNKQKHTRTIKLSAYRWTKKRCVENSFFEKSNDNYIHMCYSTHASFEEIREFILFLKPNEIEPCVYHDNAERNQLMEKIIQDIINSYKAKLETSKFLPENGVFKLKKTDQCNKRDILNLLETAPPLKKLKGFSPV